jgi:outer membrane immunogenic protein
MKKTISAVSAAVALLTTSLVAQAADLPARPAPAPAPVVVPYMYDWTGFYIGANGGYGNTHVCWGDFSTSAGPEGCNTSSGGLIGGQGGYRWQLGQMVFGLEAEGDWASLRASKASVFFPGGTDSAKVTSVGLFTGQIGYAMNAALFYLKGGAALANNNLLIQNASQSSSFYGTSHKLGATIGVGFEYGFTPNWSVGLEYDYLMMGNNNNSFSCNASCAGVLNSNVSQNINMITVRANYKFGGYGGPVVARY